MAIGPNEGAPMVTEDDARALARVAGLPLDEGRAAMLARALESDLRTIRTLRDMAVGEIFPAEMAPLARTPADDV